MEKKLPRGRVRPRGLVEDAVSGFVGSRCRCAWMLGAFRYTIECIQSPSANRYLLSIGFPSSRVCLSFVVFFRCMNDPLKHYCFFL